jgi:hypothetical protein
MSLYRWYGNFKHQWSHDQSTKKILTNKIDVKDLDIADVILKINFFMKSDGFILSQSHYVEKILNKFFKGDNIIIWQNTRFF